MPRKKPITRAVQAKYDAAGNGRRMRGWNPASTGPNRSLEGLQKVRDRARDATRNDWSGESSIQKWTTNLIGIGIVPRITRIATGPRKQALIDLWDDWCRVADADGVNTFYALQTLLVRTWLDAGEVFVRLRSRRAADGLVVPMQVQLIEADFVPLLDADVWPGLPTGNRIRSGIELDNRGRRIAYWLYREHPQDGYSGVIDKSLLLRIPADQILHVYEVKRPGQLRGVPPLASVLARLRNISDYDDAVLERQKLANLFAMFIIRGVTPDGDIDPMSGLPIDLAGDGSPLAGLQPGIVQELGYGEDVKFSNPPEAGTTYSDYMRTQHLGTAAAAGIPYEVFSGDILNISDRTLRVLINEYRRFAEQRQWQIIIPMFCQPVRDWWTQAALLAGAINVGEVDAARRVQWAPHGWAYIHPVQDPQGKKLEVDAGFRSRSSVIGERGDDPEQVDAERETDMEREKSAEIGPYAELPQVQPAVPDSTDDSDTENDQTPDPTQPANALDRALIERSEAEATYFRAMARAAAITPEPDPLAGARAELMARAVDLLKP